MRTIAVLGCVWSLLALVPACGHGQGGTGGGPGGGAADPLPPPGYGSLRQSDLALNVRNDELEVRLVPLDQRVTRLLARDVTVMTDWFRARGLPDDRLDVDTLMAELLADAGIR